MISILSSPVLTSTHTGYTRPMLEAIRVCGNCLLTEEVDAPIPMATDVATGEEVLPVRRTCSARHIAWADSPCVTGEFETKPEVPAIK